jgi:uracil-DNA glycosylase
MPNSNILEEYAPVKNEVENFISDIISDPKLEKVVKRHYRGTQILFSPLAHQPKIMFIGINPGAGYFNYHKRVVKRFSPLEKLEYTYDTNRLAKQTRKLFQLANLSKDDLKACIKSNCYFFATKNESELNKLLSHLKPLEVYTKSRNWINSIVQIVKPQIIICEGKSAFYTFVDDKNCKITDNNSTLYTCWNNTHIIGYYRTYSNIINIHEVAKLLKEKITQKN